MEVKSITNERKRTIYFLVDDDGKVIHSVYDYMLFLLRNGKKKNTVKTNCYNLKLYFEWLQISGLTYKSAVDKKSPTNKGILMNLTAFKLWLKYPAIRDNVISIASVTAIRADSTVNQIMSSVFGFYNFLVANEEINEFPVYTQMKNNSRFKGMLSEMALKKETTPRSMLKTKEPKRIIKYITLSEYEKLFEQATCLRDQVILSLLFDGALRVSEVIGLNITDFREIHKNKVFITYREDTNNPDAAVKYYSTGYIFVSDATRDLIIKYINEYLSYIDTNYFVFNMYGDTKYQPMKRNNIEKLIARLAKKAGLSKEVTPHMLRHGQAVLMLKNGARMEQIQDKLRHKSPVTTAEIYAEFDDESRRDAMQTVYDKANTKFSPDDLSLDELTEWLLEEDEDE